MAKSFGEPGASADIGASLLRVSGLGFRMQTCPNVKNQREAYDPVLGPVLLSGGVRFIVPTQLQECTVRGWRFDPATQHTWSFKPQQ